MIAVREFASSSPINQVLRPQRSPARFTGRPRSDDVGRIRTGADLSQAFFRSEQFVSRFEFVLRAVQFVEHGGYLSANADRMNGRPIGDDHEHAAALLVR